MQNWSYHKPCEIFQPEVCAQQSRCQGYDGYAGAWLWREYEVDENYEMELLPKQQISVVVKKEQVDKIVDVIKHELYTGHIGDGKIFIYDIDNVIRVRTGDEGADAL